MTLPVFPVKLTDRRGNVRAGMTVALVDADTGEHLHDMTEAENQRGLYTYEYSPADGRLYKLKINGQIDQERGAFYLNGQGPLAGIVSGELFYVRAAVDMPIETCVSITDAGEADGYPIVEPFDIDDIDSNATCIGVLTQNAVEGQDALCRRLGTETQFEGTFTPGALLYVGAGGLMVEGPPTEFGQRAVKVGVGLGEGKAYITIGENVA